MQQKQHSSGKIFGVLFSAIVIFAIIFAVLNRQNIFDWARLYNYQPPAAISQLADSTAMNDYGRKLFYVNHPELADKASFNGKCSSTEQSIVLGCYINTKGIYIYNVSDPRLKGVQEVTAAHEMLHAAYDRLNSDEKAKIDALTAQTFASLNDQRLKDTIEAYRAKDPSVVPNELHSILGTEERKLPPELENYYKKYFTNRAQVVTYSEAYEGEFTKRKVQIAEYDAQRTLLKNEIDSAEQTLQSQTQDLTNKRDQLDKLLAAKQYQPYNAQVDSFNTQVKRYNVLVASMQAKITQYNQIVAARNAIALEEQDLVKALDSRLQTQQTQ
jgi:uncharacterized protein YukE